MRTLKLIANIFIVLVALPLTIVAVLGFAFAPLQAAASVGEPSVTFEANDIPLAD